MSAHNWSMIVTNSLIAIWLIMGSGCTSAEQEYKILVLGNSITQAEINRASFRYPLWKKLIDAGIKFDFVGSMTKQLDRYSKGIPPQPDYKGYKFDKDHEGHFAWAIDQIIKGRTRDNGSGSGKLEGWVENYDADIALVHLGTNDAFKRQSNESSAKELKEVIRILREDNPRVIVLLAKLIPTLRKPGDAKAVESLNKAIPRVVEEMNTKKSPVILVDQYSGFDAVKDLYDKVHPNASGEEKMAQRWFDAIKAVVE